MPDGMPMEPPRFLTRPSESLRNITKLTKLMLWPYGLFYIGLSVVVWNYFTPALARMERFEIGWVAEIYVRNLVMVAVWVSAIHFWLYVRRAQGKQYKYDGQWLSTTSPPLPVAQPGVGQRLLEPRQRARLLDLLGGAPLLVLRQRATSRTSAGATGRAGSSTWR